ncbi:MAG: hypothetical protein MZV63_00575 [Marinilabiliales bacterium]|nr:hypothetical protein [Marinilabiliales bacterium]
MSQASDCIPRDTNLLVNVLKDLRDLGNTVIVVEHEEEIIRAADEIIDMGPARRNPRRRRLFTRAVLTSRRRTSR